MPNTPFNTDAIVPILHNMTERGILIDRNNIDPHTLSSVSSTCTGSYRAILAQVDSASILHPQFHYPGTVTNRITSTNPNLIGFPKILRDIVVARPGCVLLDGDYSQMDLHSLAWVTGDEAMQEAFLSGIDFHKRTASMLYKIPMDQVTDEQRQHAKAVSLGIIYGQSAYSIAKSENITPEDAQSLVHSFHVSYPNVHKYQEQSIRTAFYEEGLLHTFFGTPLHIEGMHCFDAQERLGAYRKCLNYPIQGTSSDVANRALVALFDALKAYDAHILVVAYDEFLVEAPASCADEVSRLIHDNMVEAALPIVMSVDVQVGHTWKEVH